MDTFILLLDRSIDLVKSFVWPATILLALFFFRKIFAYIFLSLEGFNFFGAKGRLRLPAEVIEERAEQMFEAESFKKRLDDADLDRAKLEGFADELSIREKYLREQEALFGQRVRSDTTDTTNATLSSQQLQISALLEQIASLQKHLDRGGEDEESEQSSRPTRS